MSTDGDRILHKIIEKQIGSNTFTAGSAADAALAKIVALDNLKLTDIPNLKPYAADGLKYRAQRYQPGLRRVRKAQEREDESGQSDMSSLDPKFTRMLYIPVAMDEWEDTLRLPPIAMNLAQLREHIKLKRLKADQGWASADTLERLVEKHIKEWVKHPKRTLGRIIGLDLDLAA
jgi:hypothetical protein